MASGFAPQFATELLPHKVRYAVIYHHGGIYMDTDFLVVQDDSADGRLQRESPILSYACFLLVLFLAWILLSPRTVQLRLPSLTSTAAPTCPTHTLPAATRTGHGKACAHVPLRVFSELVAGFGSCHRRAQPGLGFILWKQS